MQLGDFSPQNKRGYKDVGRDKFLLPNFPQWGFELAPLLNW